MNVSDTSVTPLSSPPSAGPAKAQSSAEAHSRVRTATGSESALLAPLQALSLSSSPERASVVRLAKLPPSPGQRALAPDTQPDAQSTAQSDLKSEGALLADAFEKKFAAVREKVKGWSSGSTQPEEPKAEKIKMLLEVLEDAKALLEYRMRLPRPEAVRMLSDSKTKSLYDSRLLDFNIVLGEVTQEDHQSNIISFSRHRDIIKAIMDASDESQTPHDLTSATARMVKCRTALVDAWQANARGISIMRDIEGLLEPNLPFLSGQEKVRYANNRRVGAAIIAASRVRMLHIWASGEGLNLRVAMQSIESDATDKLFEENGLITLLDTLPSDIYAATNRSIFDRLEQWRSAKVTDDMRTVLDDVISRLCEFAATLDDAATATRRDPDLAAMPLDHCRQLAETAWLAASDAQVLLELSRPREDPHAKAELPSTSSASRPKKGKGKAKAARSAHAAPLQTAESRPGQRRAPQPDADSSAPDEVLGVTELGTYQLVDASAAQDSILARPTAPKPKQIAKWLTQLDALLAFDISAEQRNVSMARWTGSPESAERATTRVIERLSSVAKDMGACLAALDVPRQRWPLAPTQFDDVHRKIKQLCHMGAQAQGLADSLRDNLAAATLDHTKTYCMPMQKHIKHLLAENALAPGEGLTPLAGEPGRLFEVALQPTPLRNGTLPRPIWLHIHTDLPVRASELATLPEALFASVHIKSDEQRGYNREWQNARAREGHENVIIHRGTITPDFCKKLLPR